MRKIIYPVCLAVMAILILAFSTASADVEINDANFPDPVFLDYARSNFDKNSNGMLEQAEIDEIKTLDLSGKGIGSLKGIEYLTGLEELYCTNNRLTALDFSGNSELRALYCGENPLASLDVRSNSKLMYLSCEKAELSSLDISGNKDLDSLWCYQNKLTSLDISHNHLVILICNDNQISKLDVSSSRWLDFLICYHNRLDYLDITKCNDLRPQVINSRRTTRNGYDTFGEADPDIPDTLCVDRHVTIKAGSTISYPTQITVAGGVYHISDDTAVLKKTADKTPASLTVPDAIKIQGKAFRVTAIADGACKGVGSLKEVSLGKNIRTIGKNAFASCANLTTVKGGSKVTKIGDSAFSGCKALKSVPVMDNLQTIGANAFKACVKLPKITIAKAVKSIGKNAFNGCKALKSITVKTTKLTAKTVGAGAFKNINKKATFRCPEAKLSEYKKLFVKKGAPKTCRFR